MTQLQKPPFVYMNGRLTEWDSASLHVASEALIRGISVFEGIKGYWAHDKDAFSILALRDHYVRLCQSAAMLHLPFSTSYESFVEACAMLTSKILVSGKDLWLRPTVFPLEGNWGLGTKTDLVITAYTQEMKRPDPLDVGISTWQRPADAMQPARVKCAANYTVGRNARIEGRHLGFGEMILLNTLGRVSEATGSAVLIVRNGVVITPPAYEGCLESITVNIIEKLCAELGFGFTRRPVDRSELFIADEICLAGTLAELAPVRRLQHREMPAQKVFTSIADGFWKLVRAERKTAGVELTRVN